MMTPAQNDYVLAACVEHGWIQPEQQQSSRALLQGNPSLSAIALLREQELINDEIGDWLQAAVAGLDNPHAEQVEVGEVSLPEGFRHVDDYLRYAMQAGASDVHLGPTCPPITRQSGRLMPMYPGAVAFSASATEHLARGFLTPEQIHLVEQTGSLDFCYPIPELARFRASVIRQRRGWEMVFRIINAKVPSMDALGLPDTLKTLTRYHNGLILVTGSIGSGKSTTLAAMIEQINLERSDHIITLEDPIEYVFTPARCQISQREIHLHSQSFGHSLRAALREDPDVIMVGEMRDLETISMAITASETGHLVLGTLHTSTAARTLDRLLDVFPIEQQAQIRTMVAESIRGIICQQLVPRSDGPGRALAQEIMLNTPAIATLIRESKTFMLPGVIQTGRKIGMQLMDDALLGLIDQAKISPEDAYARSENKKLFAQEMAQRQRR
jgi:twitching motility protein PilT